MPQSKEEKDLHRSEWDILVHDAKVAADDIDRLAGYFRIISVSPYPPQPEIVSETIDAICDVLSSIPRLATIGKFTHANQGGGKREPDDLG